MSYHHWTHDEDLALIRMVEAKVGRRAMTKALGRGYKSIDSRIFRLQEEGLITGTGRQPWWRQDDLRIGFLDIETANLEANAGPMLSWAMKVNKEEQPRYDLIAQDEMIDGSYDRRIVQSCVDTLLDVDAVVTYWGTGFDAPFLRTRALAWGIEFPTYGDVFHWDAYFQVKRLLKLHRNSLDSATRFLGIVGKTHLDMEMWFHARFGNQEALYYVMDHNISDVMILEALFNRLAPYSKWTRSSI